MNEQTPTTTTTLPKQPAPPWLMTGFRPFFFLGACSAALWVALWVGSLVGWWQVGGTLGALQWHSHEMLFGFVAAIFAGFLLTAVANWTKRQTASPREMAFLIALWLLGRLAVLLSGVLPLVLVGCIDVSFLLVLAWVLWRPLWQARSWRNLGFVPLLLVMALANGLLYLRALDLVGPWAARGTLLMFHLSLLLVAVIGGRIVPLFTQNKLRAIGRDVTVAKRLWLGRLAGGVLAVGAIAHVLGAPAALWSGAMAFAGGLFLVRLWGWRSLYTVDIPMLLILHLGYGCLGLGLVWYGVEGIYALGHTTAAMHLLALGCIGIMCLGMMSRVALGHTGRTIKAGPATILAFGLLVCAVPVRVVPAIWLPHWYLKGLLITAVLWCAAFLVYAAVYAPILWGPRADGKPG